MKCHYEVLNISREADDSEIKTAYRKLALKWHPDKNLDNEEYAKEQFQLVQQAYEVLSDRQERAWYDNHREQILKGSGSNANFTDNSLDVFPYFTSSCFKGYGDDEQGFYSVYRKVFETIASEDIEYMDTEEEFEQIPKFGTSDSDYDTIVGPFYAYWMSYSTKKSYVWVDPYDIRETRDRRVVKLIEKENKKVRAKAKKERNDEVRNLVAFVRKRDKRVQAHAKYLEEKNLQNRQKQEELRKQKILERKQELNEARSKEQEWSKFENMSSELKEIEKHLAEQFGEELSDSEYTDDQSIEDDNVSLNSEEDLINNLYCVACNKIFKTVNAFDNHETSKKHRDAVERLKIEMQEEENAIEEENQNTIENIENQDTIENTVDNESLNGDSSKKKKKKKKKQSLITVNSEPSDDEENIIDFGLSKKQKKKNLREKQILANGKKEKSIEDENNEQSDDEESLIEIGSSKKQKKKNLREKNIANGKKEKSKDVEVPIEMQNENIELNEKCVEDTTTTTEENHKNTVKKNIKTISKNSPIDLTHCCVVCKSNFPSKNKLFDHLKKTGHSTALPQVKTETKSKKKNR
ncbi:dnaJ homolog subfamily C member 21 [Chrysoperla carnea]|uniref:dnaJ homolog subfamily C member 21 n=1 Tax=Chrysoperla carnea TaxID=189513 RepID=UPI001D089F28|nr:dnaJ homolog subfamily C member 21 [Chrysoperla carnea]